MNRIFMVEPENITEKFVKEITKRDSGDGWIGKPFIPFGALQLELYWDSILLVEQLTGVDLEKEIRDSIIYVRKESLEKLNRVFDYWSLEELEGLFHQRLGSVEKLMQLCEEFYNDKTGFEEVCDAYTEAVYHFHLRWRFGKSMDELFKEQVKQIPKRFRFSLVNIVELGKSETVQSAEDYVKIVKKAKRRPELFEKDAFQTIGKLQKENPGLWHKIGEYAQRYMIVDYEDWRVPVQYLQIVRRITKDVQEKDYEPFLKEQFLVSSDKDEILKHVSDKDQFMRIVSLTFHQGLQKDSEHHYLIRANNLIHERLLHLAGQNGLENVYDIFELDKKDTLRYISGGIEYGKARS